MAWSSVTVFRFHPQGPKGLASLLFLTSFYHSVEPLQTLAECRERGTRDLSRPLEEASPGQSKPGLRVSERVWSGGWGLRQERRKWEVTEWRCDTRDSRWGDSPGSAVAEEVDSGRAGRAHGAWRGWIQAAVCVKDDSPK